MSAASRAFLRSRSVAVWPTGPSTSRNASPVHFSLSEALAFGLRSEHRITTGMASRDPRRNFKHSSSMEFDMTRSNFGTRKAAAWSSAFRDLRRLQQRGAGLRVPVPRFTSFAVIDRSGTDAGPKPGALVAGDDWSE